MANKNIILCSDGTGNKGGYTPDTNVFKLYNLIDIHDPETTQVKFYDNGVGTSSFNLWKSLTSAFGTGFKENVLDLYGYLAKAYQPGDRIFVFGFSRGAATARAFNGFVAHCGLINGHDLEPEKLNDKVEELFDFYQKKSDPQSIPDIGVEILRPEIQMIGVWDTVSALGAPKRTEAFGPVMAIITVALKGLDILIDTILPNSFYNYGITPNIQNAYQALAIDDERTAFWPEVWDETTQAAKHCNIEQAWFMGMHADVGGGYSRGTLANTPLEWMLLRARHHGVVFKKRALKDVSASTNTEGVMHNSRSGFGVLYRYHPRQIRVLCDGLTRAPVKLHTSVIKRLGLAPADYCPTSLPENFEIVSSVIGDSGEVVDADDLSEWHENRLLIEGSIRKRKILYNWMLVVLIGIVVVSGYFWMNPVVEQARVGVFGHLADILTYILPDYFNSVVEKAISQKPVYGMLVIGALVAMFVYGNKLRANTRHFSRKQKRVLLEHIASDRY